MKKRLFTVSFLLLCLSFPIASRATTHRFALIVGNNEGTTEKIPLRYAEQDAKNLYKTLIQIGGFSKNRVRLLLGEDPGAVYGALRSLRTQAEELARNGGDQILFLFYFSGHSEGGSLELGPFPLDFGTLRDEAKKIPASTRILIVDACQSGQLIRSKGGIPVPPIPLNLNQTEIPKGEILITSSLDLEEALESVELKGSFFTHNLVSGLRGAADFDRDGRVSVSEVYSYASRKTSSKAFQFQKRQHPTFEFNLSGAGEIYLTHIGGHAPLLALAPSEQGEFLVYEKRSRALVAEIDKSQGTQSFIALPEGEMLVRKRKEGYYVEQEFSAQAAGLYHFNEESGKKIRIGKARRILTYALADEGGIGKLLREGEIVKLRLLETIGTKTSQIGDKIRLEAAEDLYIDDSLVIAAGAPATGEILAMREKRGLVHGELVCRLGYVQAIDGQWVPLNSIISRSPAGLRRVREGDNPLSPVGSDTETDVASGITAFFFLPFYPFLKGRNAVLKEGTLFDAYVSRDVRIR
jgi:hypothetical protein